MFRGGLDNSCCITSGLLFSPSDIRIYLLKSFSRQFLLRFSSFNHMYAYCVANNMKQNLPIQIFCIETASLERVLLHSIPPIPSYIIQITSEAIEVKLSLESRYFLTISIHMEEIRFIIKSIKIFIQSIVLSFKLKLCLSILTFNKNKYVEMQKEKI